jgi:hypothetical protein
MTILDRLFSFPFAQANYLINISQRHKFIYFEIPKAACSTIKRNLQLLEVDYDEDKLSKQVHNKKESPLQSPSDLGSKFAEILFSRDFFIFTFIRNPFTRVLSGYLDKIVTNAWERKRHAPRFGLDPAKDIGFEEFLEKLRLMPDYNRDIHWKSQTAILSMDKIEYDLIGRFENFGNFFPLVLKELQGEKNYNSSNSIETVNFHTTKASEKIDTYFNSNIQEMIVDIYCHDFEVLRYSKNCKFAAF